MAFACKEEEQPVRFERFVGFRHRENRKAEVAAVEALTGVGA